MSLRGKTIVITGASRGIGRAIALRCAKDGAHLVIASKTSDPHPKLAGTIHSVAEEVVAAGGKALAVQVDVRSEEDVQQMVDETVKTFGGIDVLINNAGAISLTDIESTSMKRFDLMLGINARAVFLCTKLCLPHLKKSKNAHVLSMSPPVSQDPKWMKGHGAYTLSKFGMTMLSLGLAEELREYGVAVNTLWPRTVIWTAALDMLLGQEGEKNSRSPDIVADAAYEIICTQNLTLTGQALLDESFLRTRGMSDFSKYAMAAGVEPMLDLYVDA